MIHSPSVLPFVVFFPYHSYKTVSGNMCRLGTMWYSYCSSCLLLPWLKDIGKAFFFESEAILKFIWSLASLTKVPWFYTWFYWHIGIYKHYEWVNRQIDRWMDR